MRARADSKFRPVLKDPWFYPLSLFTNICFKFQEIDAKVRTVVDEATKQAKSEPEIGVEELSADIYGNCLEPEIRGIRPDAPLQHISVAQRN